MGLKRKPKPDRRIAVALSDFHCGLRLGLLSPATTLKDCNGDEWSPALTETQNYLWSIYQQHLASVVHLAQDDPVILLLLGDLTQGLKHWSGVWGTRLYDHIEGAVACLDPWFDRCNIQAVRLALGTEAHTQEGTSEFLIAERLQAKHPGIDVGVAQHYKLSIDGISLDIAHHGPGGGIRQWTSGNVAGHYLKSLMLEERVNKDVIPDVVLRAHVHRWIRESNTLHTKQGDLFSEILVIPGYCGINPFARKVTRSVLTQTHGLVALEIVDGMLKQIHPFTRMMDVRKEERL